MTTASVTMTTAKQIMKNLPTVVASIEIGVSDGELVVKVVMDGKAYFWSAKNARQIGREWVMKGVAACVMECPALEFKIGDHETLIEPEALIAAGMDLLTTGAVLAGIGLIDNWLKDTHEFGIDVNAVNELLQPTDEPK